MAQIFAGKEAIVKVAALDFDHLALLVSPLRLDRYLAEVRGSKPLAAELYAWNVDIGAALWHLIAYLEVACRNAMADELDSLIRAAAAPRAQWFNHERWFSPNQRRLIRQAKAEARRLGYTHGRVISQLKFGFWVSLLDPSHEHVLWVPGLRLAFPASPGKRESVHGQLRWVNGLRNDIAHHNRLFPLDVIRAEEGILRVAFWLDPAFADWLAGESRVHEVAARRPRLPPTARYGRRGVVAE